MVLRRAQLLLQPAVGQRLPFRDAVVQAQAYGVLCDIHSSSSPPSSSSSMMHHCADPLRQAPRGRREMSTSGSTAGALWPAIERHQQRLFTSAHTLPPGSSTISTLAATGELVNVAHLEGVVVNVQCGFAIGHEGDEEPLLRSSSSATERKGDEHIRKAVSVMKSYIVCNPLLQFFLLLSDGAQGSSDGGNGPAGVPIAVRCSMSEDAITAKLEALAGQSKVSSTRDKSCGVNEAAAAVAVKEGKSLEERMSDYAAWAVQELQDRRVIVSGELHMEPRYDGDVMRVVLVPVLWLPTDALCSAYHVVG